MSAISPYIPAYSPFDPNEEAPLADTKECTPPISPPNYNDILIVPKEYLLLPNHPDLSQMANSTVAYTMDSNNNVISYATELDKNPDEVFKLFMSHLSAPQVLIRIEGNLRTAIKIRASLNSGTIKVITGKLVRGLLPTAMDILQLYSFSSLLLFKLSSQ
jgi:hypothetical protein